MYLQHNTFWQQLLVAQKATTINTIPYSRYQEKYQLHHHFNQHWKPRPGQSRPCRAAVMVRAINKTLFNMNATAATSTPAAATTTLPTTFSQMLHPTFSFHQNRSKNTAEKNRMNNKKTTKKLRMYVAGFCCSCIAKIAAKHQENVAKKQLISPKMRSHFYAAFISYDRYRCSCWCRFWGM